MGKRRNDSTIRILMLGAPGVGKSALESRFTTNEFPAAYDTSLTRHSRRCVTLSPKDQEPDSETRPLDTSYGLTIPLLSDRDDRLTTQSSIFSNPASIQDPDSAEHITAQTLESFSGEPITCSDCERENSTFLVEVINSPDLQHPKKRAKTLLNGSYDAVLLVYDIGSRGSFETVADLHNEIPLSARSGHGSLGRRKGWLRFLGRGAGEIVVGLVGNKSDTDTDFEAIDFDVGGILLEKEEALLKDVASEREVVHPLFRESRVFDQNLPFSPISMGSFGAIQRDSILAAARRSIVSADAAMDARLSVSSTQRSVHTVRAANEKRLPHFARRSSRSSKVESWLEIGTPVIESTAREQIVEGDGPANVNAYDSSSSTTAVRRQISKLEGELVARTLLLQVPFVETSAKTGENVEETPEVSPPSQTSPKCLTESGKGRQGPEREYYEQSYKALWPHEIIQAHTTQRIHVPYGDDQFPGGARRNVLTRGI
ncbi:hypothetical protein JX266_001196 [Neoarthrinium moseri]|nr:hypothetical protein JX266_001196 [Neoarthrinium moseri]